MVSRLKLMVDVSPRDLIMSPGKFPRVHNVHCTCIFVKGGKDHLIVFKKKNFRTYCQLLPKSAAYLLIFFF